MFQVCRLIGGFEWLICVSVGLAPMLFNRPASAGDCGDTSPDYSARRVVTVGDETKVSKVYISGWKTREEQTGPNGRQSITILLPEQGVHYIFDPGRREGVQLKLPPRPPAASKTNSRQTVDKQPDGTAVRHTQLLADGEWKDVTTTICRPDGVMLEQKFIFPDINGNLLNGRLTQSDINVGPLSKSLFEVPASVVLKRP
jgi:hypothetical protein